MRRPASFLAAIAVIALALAPALAEARPGSNRSSGSRGSQTYSAPPSTATAPGQARPMERTATEPSRAASPAAAAARPPVGAPGGFFSRNPLMAGLMGGLLGAGLFGLLSGSGLFGGMAGFASIMGLLLQIALIAGLVYLAMRLIRGRRAPQPAMAGLPNAMPNGMARDMPNGMARDMPSGMARDMHDAPRPMMGGGMGAGPARPTADIPISPEDFQAFERMLQDINAAWSRQDLGAMRRLATAEMAQYFADDLAELSGRGLRNETRDLVLEQGDLAQSWREGGRDYATVAMRFSLIDVTRRVADGSVAEGDPTRRTEATELWTFVRPVGGAWMLSAIQQTG